MTQDQQGAEAAELSLTTRKPAGDPYHMDVSISHSSCGRGSDLQRMVSRNPIRVLAPRPPATVSGVNAANDQPVSLYTSSFGGGLVGGDHVNMRIQVKDKATCLFGTQASTKIFKVDHSSETSVADSADWDAPYQAGAIQRLEAYVGDDAALIVAPDQVSPFRDSVYFQDQVFKVQRSSTLMVIDWITSGRLAHGECWDLTRLYTRNAIAIDGKIQLIDALALAREDELTETFKLGDFHCYATMILAGERLAEMAELITTDIYRSRIHRGETHSSLTSISPCGDGTNSHLWIVRMLARDVEQVRSRLSDWMTAIETLTGQHPWARKW